MTFEFYAAGLNSDRSKQFYATNGKLNGFMSTNLKFSGWRAWHDNLSGYTKEVNISKLEDLKEFLTENEYLQFQREIFEKII